MKRSGFKQKQRKPLKRTPFKRKKAPRKPKKAVAVAKRPKLPKPGTIRTKADNLLTPIIKELYPYCLLQGSQNCAGVTQVAHHHVHKSKSSRLRYDLYNLIPLCGACHSMLHNDESFWGAKVAQLRGPEWFIYIERAKRESVKTDVHFYLFRYEKLKETLEKISRDEREKETLLSSLQQTP